MDSHWFQHPAEYIDKIPNLISVIRKSIHKGHCEYFYLHECDSIKQCDIDATELLNQEQEKQDDHWLITGWTEKASPFRCLKALTLHWCK